MDLELPNTVPRTLNASASHCMGPPTSIIPTEHHAGRAVGSLGEAPAGMPPLAGRTQRQELKTTQQEMAGDAKFEELASSAAAARQELEAKQQEFVAAANARKYELASTTKPVLQSKEKEVVNAIGAEAHPVVAA